MLQSLTNARIRTYEQNIAVILSLYEWDTCGRQCHCSLSPSSTFVLPCTAFCMRAIELDGLLDRHRLLPAPLGQRRSMPRSLLKKTSPKAMPFREGTPRFRRPASSIEPSGLRRRSCSDPRTKTSEEPHCPSVAAPSADYCLPLRRAKANPPMASRPIVAGSGTVLAAFQLASRRLRSLSWTGAVPSNSPLPQPPS